MSTQEHLFVTTVLASLVLLFVACGSASENPQNNQLGDVSRLNEKTVASNTGSLSDSEDITPGQLNPQLEPASATDKGPANTDREALMALYNSADGPSWHSSHTWASANSINEWEGVSTDDQGRVTSLIITDSELSGELPSELGNLEDLTLSYTTG